MVSYIFISSSIQLGISEIKRQTEQLKISTFDQVNLELETGDKGMSYIGIGEIKKLLQKVYLKPLESPYKAIIIRDAQSLTSEAQNALLKIIEEPPEHTYIYLLTNSLNALLPTIQSRCSIIDLNQKEINYEEIKIQIPSSIGEKLALAEKLSKQKSIALAFMQDLLKNYHRRLHAEKNQTKLLSEIREIEKSLRLLQTTNVNLRLCLEHVLLELKR